MIYLAGPIDYGGNPEARHEAFEAAAPNRAIFCPACMYVEGADAMYNLRRNMDALERADVMVVGWDAPTQPSFGTPVEIWTRVHAQKRVIVVGSLGRGMFADVVRESGYVAECSTWEQAAAMLAFAPRPQDSGGMKPM